LISFILIFTTVFIRDSLIKSNLSEAQSNLLAQNNILSNQITPYITNYENDFTKQYIEDILKQYAVENKIRTLIIDTDYHVIFDAYDQYNNEDLINDEITAAMMGNSTANIYEYNNHFIMYTAVPIIENNKINGVSFMSVDADSIFESVNDIIEKLMAIFAISIIASVAISILFAQILAKPIEDLTESVKKITTGHYNARVSVASNDEIGELGNAFNLMSSQIYQVDDRRKKFVSNVSHELKTPMTSMKIVSDTLLSQEHWDESVYREFLLDINDEIVRLNKIIDSLLYLVKVEKEDISLEYSITYVNYLIEKVIKTLNPIAVSKGIEIKFITSNKVQIQLDQEKIQQCLLNIIGNAVKYTPKNGKVVVELLELKDSVSILVKDTGMGIPEKDIPFIFDRFYRVDEARARQTGGTGLGLSISQQIVQLHQGTIVISSEVNIGTCVSISLPKI